MFVFNGEGWSLIMNVGVLMEHSAVFMFSLWLLSDC